MAPANDRDGLRTAGAEQWYPVAGGVRVYRHTFAGVNGSGFLRPLVDAAGLEYVGVAGAAMFQRGGLAGGDADGERTCPVWQDGEFQFGFLGTATQADVGRVAYAVDERTVTTERTLTAQGYAVGRVAKRVAPGAVRVNITGFATVALALWLAGWRPEFTLEPHTVSGLELGKNYRLGVTLPGTFANRTYTGELFCVEPTVGAKVVINRDTARKTAGYCGWNLYVPTDLPSAYYGAGSFEVVAHFEGRGWPLGPGPFAGVWDGPSEIL